MVELRTHTFITPYIRIKVLIAPRYHCDKRQFDIRVHPLEEILTLWV